ncbi:MAG TPA: SIMPL domain-containing protein [Pyrinomonadaceae bacterium]|nr:SIMPL domain-containing protein [Pyrinomonadaceae bacterium]
MKRVLPLMLSALLFASLLLSAAPPRAAAQERPGPRLITVSGEAEVNVVPDEVFFDVTVQTVNRDLKVAKAQTDERLKKLVELTRRYGVEARDVQTDYISVEPRYRGNNETRQFLGFAVRKDLAFTLRDISKAEAMLSEVIETGVTRINDIDFRTSEMRKHRDQARAMAIRAAQEKAVALTKEIGQKIGKAYSIEEVSATASPMAQNYTSNTVGFSGDGEASSGTLSIGQIKVNARVVVRFELE